MVLINRESLLAVLVPPIAGIAQSAEVARVITASQDSTLTATSNVQTAPQIVKFVNQVLLAALLALFVMTVTPTMVARQRAWLSRLNRVGLTVEFVLMASANNVLMVEKYHPAAHVCVLQTVTLV